MAEVFHPLSLAFFKASVVLHIPVLTAFAALVLEHAYSISVLLADQPEITSKTKRNIPITSKDKRQILKVP